MQANDSSYASLNRRVDSKMKDMTIKVACAISKIDMIVMPDPTSDAVWPAMNTIRPGCAMLTSE